MSPIGFSPRQNLLDIAMTQHYSCVMISPFDSSGNLPPGVHQATWQEFVRRFGKSTHRRMLLTGLKAALEALRAAGCRTVYIDGSFVTAKRVPNDFDACWDIDGVDPALLDPILLSFDNGRAAQKAKYLGELFPAQFQEGAAGLPFLSSSKSTKNSVTRRVSSPWIFGGYHDKKRATVPHHEGASGQT
jgi:hypothetical protein